MSQERVCEICGSTFTCGAPGPCWCSSIDIDKAKRDLISTVATGCVCKECLTKNSK